MANIIRIKRGHNITPDVTLLAGELALDLTSGILYAGNEAGKPTKIKGVAEKLEVAQLIKLTGDVTGEANFDGSTAAEITATLRNIVTGDTVNGITFNEKGLITAAEEIIYKVEDIDGLTEALAGKVDKEAGKSLVSDDEIARLAGVNNYDDSELRELIDDKADVSALDGLATEEFVTTEIGKIDHSAYALKTEVTEALNDKADKTVVEGIDTRLTTAEGKITTLEGTVANKANTSDVYTKTDVDEKVTELNTAIGNANTEIAKKANSDDVYTKTEIDGKLASAMHYKGTVDNVDALDAAEKEVGNVYNVADTGHNYAWNGTEWDKLAGVVDLSAYYTIDQVNAELAKKLDEDTFNTIIADYAKTTDVNTELAKKADASALTALEEVVETKAAQSDLEALTTTVGTKADASALTTLEGTVTANTEAIATKADQTALDAVEAKVDAIEVPTNVSDLTNDAGYVTETELTAKNYAEKATTLSGYGIEDAYTKDETHIAVQEILDGTKVLTDDTIIDGGTF